MSPYVVTGKEHKLRKVVNSGTWLCSFIPETRNIVVSKAPDAALAARYVLKTGNGKRGSLKMVSEFPPAGTIGLGLSVSTILLEIVLGDGPDDFIDVLPGFTLKWPQKYANQGVGIRIIIQDTSGAVHAFRYSLFAIPTFIQWPPTLRGSGISSQLTWRRGLPQRLAFQVSRVKQHTIVKILFVYSVIKTSDVVVDLELISQRALDDAKAAITGKPVPRLLASREWGLQHLI